MNSDQALIQFVQAYAPQQQQQAEAAASIQNNLDAILSKKKLELKQLQAENKKKNQDQKRKERAEDRGGMRKTRAGMSAFLAGKLKANKKSESSLMKLIKKILGVGAVIGGGVLLYKKFKEPIDKAMGTLKNKLVEMFQKFGEWVMPHAERIGKDLGEKLIGGLKWAVEEGIKTLGNWAGGLAKEHFVKPLKEWADGFMVKTGLKALLTPGKTIRDAITGGEDFSEAHDYIDGQMVDAGFNKRGLAEDFNRRGRRVPNKGDRARRQALMERREKLAKLRKERDAALMEIYNDKSHRYGSSEKEAELEAVRNNYRDKIMDVAFGDDVVEKRQGGGLLGKMNDKNINKVSAAPGMCVTGSLETMQASGVPNPAATGRDKGNNPRGAIVQLIKNHGWNSIGGKSVELNSPYGDVNTKSMSAAQYSEMVAAGSIPSGALVFQTRHNSWNGTSPSSRGYDMAIAQNGGKSHWNGQNMPQLVYGSNTNRVIVLTPGGSIPEGSSVPSDDGSERTSSGQNSGTSSSGFFGIDFGGMGDVLGSLFGNISESLLKLLGPVGNIISDFMGTMGDALKNVFAGDTTDESPIGSMSSLQATTQSNVDRFQIAQSNFADQVANASAAAQVIVVKRRAVTTSNVPSPGQETSADVSGHNDGETSLNSGVDPVALSDEMYRQITAASW